MSFDTLEELLGFTFKDKSIIQNAFIHRSYLNEARENLNSNERLEFLGDSILSFIVSKYLYATFPDLPEGELTSLRSYLKLSKGEAESNGSENPSLLADTFEALLGAIFIEHGLPKVEKVIDKFFLPKLPLIIAHKTYKDSKSTLQEIVQEKTRTSPAYKVLKEIGPDHAKTFTVGVYQNDKLLGTVTGKSKQEAEQMAAGDALEKWEK